MNRFRYSAIATLAMALALAGCDREATGQVAAVVNGEEITLQEVNAELQGAALTEGTDREAAQRVALQRVVDRRIMAQAAREDGMDQSPEYLVRKRQLDDSLLLQMLSQNVEQNIEMPSQGEIDAFIAENPALFANRQIYTLDRIQFAAPADMQQLSVLEDDMSMAEVVASLNDLGIDFQRGESEMDSAQVGQERLDRIQALPDGEPFVVIENGIVYVAVVTGSRPAPMADDQRQPIAVAALRRRKLNESLQNRLEAEKAAAEVSYQDGFGPPQEGATTREGDLTEG